MGIEYAVIPGLFTLAGVIIGAILSTVTQVHLENRRENRDVRRAARLIDSDLFNAEVAAETTVEKNTLWVNNQRLTTEGWQKYRDIIASELTEADWVAVMVAVQAVNQLQATRDVHLQIQLAELSMDIAMEATLASAHRLGLDIISPAPKIDSDIVASQIKPKLAHISKGRAALKRLTRNNRAGR